MNDPVRITPEKAVEILKENGKIVTLDEAQLILDFLYRMAKLELKQRLQR